MNEQNASRNVKSRIKQEDKPFFAVFLNMARHNADRTITRIRDESRVDGAVNEDSLADAPVLQELLKKDSKNPLPLTQYEIIERIKRYFPFIRIYFDEIDRSKSISPQKYYNRLSSLLKMLNKHRNYFAHFKSDVPNPPEDRKIIPFLEKIFDASVNQVKKRFQLAERDVQHLRRKIGDPEKKKKTIPNPDFHQEFKDNDGNFTEKGIAFLVSLFLEKKEIYLFLKKLKGFKRGEEKKYRATLECYCTYRMKLPRMRIESVDTKNALALDMLQELYRCPAKLFDLLDKEKQNSFRVSLGEAEHETDELEPEILKKRYRDRFPFFCLRWFDFQNFDKLRFQIDLGRYYYKFYEKSLMNESTIHRSLSRRLLAFGKPDELKALKEEEWKKWIVESSKLTEDWKTPYITDTRPHYHIEANQIGIKLNQNVSPNEEGKTPKTTFKALPHIDFNATKPGPLLAKPDAWISVHELPAMVFHTILTNGKTTEKVIKHYICEVKTFFKAIMNGNFHQDTSGNWKEFIQKKYKINPTHIPKAMVNYFDKKSSDLDDYKKHKCERMKAQNKKWQYKLKFDGEKRDEKKSTAGKGKWNPLKPGEVASLLTQDILLLQESLPETHGTDKITSANYQALQVAFAFYGRDKESLPNILTCSGLLQGKNPHPFLHKMRKKAGEYKDIFAFWKDYLAKREIFLEKCLEKKEFNHHFLRPQRNYYRDESHEAIKELAKKLRNSEPINLPRGLFLRALRPRLKGGEKDNTIFLIQKYFKKRGDSSQPFYDYKRCYPFEGKVANYKLSGKFPEELKCNKEIKNIISHLPERTKNRETTVKNLFRLYKKMEHNEKKLRFVKATDMLLLIMAEKLLGLDSKDLKLKDISPDYDTSILSENCKNLSFPITSNDGKTRIKITIESMKIKNYGDLKALQYDHRVKTLIPWYKNDSEVPKVNIDRELSVYEEKRECIFSFCQEFEKEILKKFSHDFSGEEIYVGFKTILEKFELCNEDESLTEFLGMVRNAFSHNEYPDKSIFGGISDEKEITESIFKEVECRFLEAISLVKDYREKN